MVLMHMCQRPLHMQANLVPRLYRIMLYSAYHNKAWELGYVQAGMPSIHFTSFPGFPASSAATG